MPVPSTSSPNPVSSQSRWIERAPRRISPWLSGLAVATILAGPVLNHQTARADDLDSPFKIAAGNTENGPIVSLVQPSFNDVVRDVAPILIAVENRRYPAKSVEMFVDGQLATPNGGLSMSALPSAQFNWDTSRYVDGPHRLLVRVTDTQGFIGVSEVTVFVNNNGTADIQAPTLNWVNVKSGEVLSKQQNLQLAVADNFGVKMVIAQLFRADAPTEAIRGWFLNYPPYVVKLDTTKLPDAVYILNAKAFDALENQGDAPPLYLGFSNFTISPTDQSQMMEKLATLSGKNNSAQSGQTPTKVAVAPQVTGNATSNKNPMPPTATDETRIVKSTDDTKVNIDPVWNPNGGATSNGAKLGAPLATLTKPRYAGTPDGIARSSSTLPRAASRVNPPLTSAPSATMRAVPPAVNNRPSGEPVLDTKKAGNPNDSRIAMGTLPEIARSQNARAVASRPTTGLRPTADAASEAIVARSGEPNVSAAALPSMPTRIAIAELPENATSPRVPSAQASRPDFAPRALETNTSPTLNVPRAAFSGPSASVSSLPVPATRIAAAPPIESAASKTNPATRPNAPARVTQPMAALPSAPRDEKKNVAAITVSPAWSVQSAKLPATYVAPRDEMLSTVAKRFGLPAATLASANALRADAKLKKGASLRVPQPLVVMMDGKPVTGDIGSMLVGSTSVTPFRFLFEQQGGTMKWDGQTQRVTAAKGDMKVTLTIGSKTAVVNQKEVMMDLAAFLLSGRTMVPVRFFEDALHAEVEWEPTTGRLYIAMSAPGK